MEHDGTIVSGERRAQKLGAAIPAPKDTKPDFAITSALIEKLGGEALPSSTSDVFGMFVKKEPVFQGLSYEKLGETHAQWPLVGRNDVYYGGTGYENTFGLGIVLPLVTGETSLPRKMRMPEAVKPIKTQWLALPITKLYDHQLTTTMSLLKDRIAQHVLNIHPEDATGLNLVNEANATLKFNGKEFIGKIKINADQPKGVLLVTRHSGLPILQPTAVELTINPSETTSTERGTL